ncbi:LysM peptidoglycan-binding domain-containing protein [candidate division KSB1 bacterium]|nr:LysM peptidoglycan-binding domain-containing protein [candidate division KSB1 bacterium]RQW08791.1 MAG: LysM peptidoglycan-binding domain-containing protein [candidate division KSB1 bacterium]
MTNKPVIMILLSLVLLGASLSFAQDKMTMEEYEKQLAEWQQRLDAADKGKVDCGTANEALTSEMDAVQAETEKVWAAILEEIGTDQAGVDAFRKDLEALNARCDGLLALTPEELFKKRDEVQAIETELAAAKGNRIAALTAMQDLIATIEGKLTQIKNKMPKAVYDEYTVVVGDYLWKISGKDQIYGDPTHWMRIYSYNLDQIDDPDLIYPDWVLKIQREVGADEYLVAKGDYLQKIAQNPQVLGDPSSWTKIYEKNKRIVGDDPNLIFPHTVLVIPTE